MTTDREDFEKLYPHLPQEFVDAVFKQGEHCLYGASYSHTYLGCAGSMQASFDKVSRVSFATVEGSAAHYWGEQALLGEFDLDMGVGAEYVGDLNGAECIIELDQDMADYLKEYLVYCEKFLKSDSIVMVEKKVSFSAYVPNGYGPGDMVIYNPSDKELIVIDLKYGKGIPVYAENNSQPSIYGLGAYDELSVKHEIESIRLCIFQPRIDNISESVLSASDIEDFGKYLQQGVIKTFAKDPEFNPGEKQCMFCRSSGNCKAEAEYSMSIALEGFEDIRDLDKKDLKYVNPFDLSDRDLANVADRIKLLSKFLEQSKEVIKDRIRQGFDIIGHKLIKGNKTKFWTDPEAALLLLQRSKLKAEQYAPRKLVTVTQLIELSPKHAVLKKFQGNGFQQDKLVLESHAKDALYRDSFDSIEEEEDDLDLDFLD